MTPQPMRAPAWPEGWVAKSSGSWWMTTVRPSEVVRVLVDDHGAAQDVRDGKPVGEDAEIGVPAAAEQGRQVPGVAGVLAPIQDQVAAGALKVRGSTGVPLVDMEAEDPGGAGAALVGETVDLGGDQDAPLLG